jgi:basic membrane protein A
MKKFLILATFLLGVGAFAFAGGGQQTRKKTKTLSGQQYRKQITCLLVSDMSGINDESFNQAAWQGVVNFYGDTRDNPKSRGKLYDYISVPSKEQYVPILQQATDNGYDVIIAAGVTFADSLRKIAIQNPDQKYMIVDSDRVNLPNVLSAVFAEHQGSYIVGVAAAQKAVEDKIENPKFGFLGGIQSSDITKFEVGYVQGILSVLPKAQIVDCYVGNWTSPDRAQVQAKDWFDSGVFMIYSAAGGSGLGVIAQAKEYRRAGKNVWAIGVDTDQYELGIYNGMDSAVYTSMVKRVDTAVRYCLNMVRNGSFNGGVITLDLAQKGVDYARTNPAMSDTVKARCDDVAAGIAANSITVLSTYTECKALPGFPQNLQARDE